MQQDEGALGRRESQRHGCHSAISWKAILGPGHPRSSEVELVWSFILAIAMTPPMERWKRTILIAISPVSSPPTPAVRYNARIYTGIRKRRPAYVRTFPFKKFIHFLKRARMCVLYSDWL